MSLGRDIRKIRPFGAIEQEAMLNLRVPPTSLAARPGEVQVMSAGKGRAHFARFALMKPRGLTSRGNLGDRGISGFEHAFRLRDSSGRIAPFGMTGP